LDFTVYILLYSIIKEGAIVNIKINIYLILIIVALGVLINVIIFIVDAVFKRL